MHAVLRVDHQLLPQRIRLGSFGIDILVHSRRADPSQQARKLADVLLDVVLAIGRLDREVDRLVLGVVRAGEGEGGEEVEGEDAVGGGVVDRLELAIAGHERVSEEARERERETHEAGLVEA